jgi:hypothetical protein
MKSFTIALFCGTIGFIAGLALVNKFSFGDCWRSCTPSEIQEEVEKLNQNIEESLSKIIDT